MLSGGSSAAHLVSLDQRLDDGFEEIDWHPTTAQPRPLRQFSKFSLPPGLGSRVDTIIPRGGAHRPAAFRSETIVHLLSIETRTKSRNKQSRTKARSAMLGRQFDAARRFQCYTVHLQSTAI